jgi:hypothetical protein
MTRDPAGKHGPLGSGLGIVSLKTVSLSSLSSPHSLVTIQCKVNLLATLVKVANSFAASVK